ncbi:hypothetical protein M9H77_35431 [Catharanthus roseus]|uniref:Uncharacterized protein n=1 Tax=Catharanthus roseus TaxID=4058 RepID=A0ACB9ZQA4_CATRO|nr:hypothetical protein M9H77_35431 [Catharanthus roseus]
MNYRRDQRGSRSLLFDDIEGGGLRASYSQDISDIDERDNDKAIDTLHDRVNFLKRLTGDVHEEVENHNRMLDRMGNDMDASRGILSGTIDRFKMVFEKKSNRRMCKLVAYFVVSFLVLCYVIR